MQMADEIPIYLSKHRDSHKAYKLGRRNRCVT